MLGTIVLVILILLLVGALPNWPHSAKMGLRAVRDIGNRSHRRADTRFSRKDIGASAHSEGTCL